MSQYEALTSTDTLELTDTAFWAFYEEDNSCEVLNTRSPRTLDEQGEPDPPPDGPGT